MLYSAASNARLESVSMGMVAICETFDKLDAEGVIKLNNGERVAVLAACFNAVLEGPLRDKATVGDLIGIAKNMQSEAKRLKIPEYGGAVRYVQRHLQEY